MPTDNQTCTLTVISSMATRHVLAQLTDLYERECGQPVSVLSVGGVEAARRIQEGEHFDIVILAADAIERLNQSGHVIPESQIDLASSRIAVAVKLGEAQRDISSEAAVRDTVQKAASIGYSTGPSGTHIVGLFRRWGILDAIAPRIVEALPGVPVGRLVAEGKVEIGFQQLSEFVHESGIDVIGTLPPAIQAVTLFSAAVCATTSNRKAASAFIKCICSPESDAVKIDNGMEPVKP